MADLSSKEVEKVEFAFSIYDEVGSGVIDGIDLGNVLRALGTNPTNATIEKLGGTKKKGEKTFTLEEVLPIYSQVKKDKEQGCYEDFVECLKLYDKQENGTMLAAELSHTLLSLVTGQPAVIGAFTLACLTLKRLPSVNQFLSVFNLRLGERLTDLECEIILRDCMDKEDDDGFIPFVPFVKKMMAL